MTAPVEPPRRAYGFAVAATSMVVVIGGVAAPSPVYPLYQAEWHLSQAMLTLLFAIYVVGLLVVLLTAGSLSDHVGRRPVLIAATAISIVGLLVLALAGGAGAVLVARIIQGVAMALAVGTLGAALLDLAPPHRERLAATLNGALPPVGLSLGAVLGGALVEFGPDPTRLVYLIFAATDVVLLVLAFFLPERHPRRPGALASLVPKVTLPAQVRRVFFAVVGCLLAAWALGGLYLGLGAGVVRTVFDIPQALVGGVAIAAVTAVGAVTGILLQGVRARLVLITGAVALIVGPALMMIAVVSGSIVLFFVSSVVAGVGFGGGFQGGLRLIVAESPEDQRSGVLSTVYLVSYVAFAVPALIAGLLTPSFGLVHVVLGYCVLLAVLAAIALVLQLGGPRRRTTELSAEADELAENG